MGRTRSITEAGKSGSTPMSTLWLIFDVSLPASISISTVICARARGGPQAQMTVWSRPACWAKVAHSTL